jgi:hypothetical protein
MANYDFSSARGALAISSAVMIIFGFLLTENYFDESMSFLLLVLGLLLYVGGWVGISVVASAKDDFLRTFSYEKQGIVSLVVMITSLMTIVPIVMPQLFDYKNVFVYGGFLLLVAAWIGFCVANSHISGTFDKTKFGYLFSGAFLIVVGIVILFRYRKFRVETLSPTNDIGKVAVYNPGLVLFTIGWVLVVMGIAKTPDNDLIKGKTQALDHVNYLYKHDFKFGTVILNKPGKYVLMEDIDFNPIPRGHENEHILYKHFPDLRKHDKDAYRLGFFAAVAIVSDNVELDLNKHYIKQDVDFYLMQRFFACIELADQPFIPGKGPHDFGEDIKSAKNVKIHNGTLGLSSHHGIHGNLNIGVTIENLVIRDFEVAAVHLNGAENVHMHNITAGPSLGPSSSEMKVPVSGDWSALINLTREAERFPLIPNQHDELIQAIENNKKVINTIFTSLKNNQILPEYKQFYNASGFPDGSSMFGIALHETFNVGPPTLKDKPDVISRNIHMDNIKIHDLHLETSPVNTICHTKDKPMKDNTGAVLNLLHCIQKGTKKLKPGPLHTLQILMAKYKMGCVSPDKTSQHHKCPFVKDLNQNTIPEDVVNMILNGNINYGIVDKYEKACDTDIMHHDIKGLVGLKLEGVEDFEIYNLDISKLDNRTPIKKGNMMCNNSAQKNRMKHISVVSSKNVKINSKLPILSTHIDKIGENQNVIIN